MAGSKIKRGLTIALTAAILASLTPADAQQHRGKMRRQRTTVTTPATNPSFSFGITNIEYKQDDDLVRVCGNLSGTPHASNRIDGVTLKAGDRQVDANDIDGVDFERYFIWEDDGNIYLEIDFPGYTQSKELLDNKRECQLIFHTIKGDVTILATDNKHKKRK